MVRHQEEENQKLHEALRTLLLQSNAPSREDELAAGVAGVSLVSDANMDAEGTSESENHEAIEIDGLYVCSKCAWEVADGECEGCGLAYEWSQEVRQAS